MKAKEIINMFFGKQPKVRYVRAITLLIILVACFTLIQNVGCGVKDGKFWFEWQPAAEIKIEK